MRVDDLVKINAHLGGSGGLLKLWFTNDERTAKFGEPMIRAVPNKIAGTQDAVHSAIRKIVLPRSKQSRESRTELGDSVSDLYDINQLVPLTVRYAVTIMHFPTDDAGGAMAKTTAERQAAYRERQDSGGADGNGQRRVSMWLSTGAALALARLARRYGVTQRELVENMLIAEDERVLATMAIDTPEWDTYFARSRTAVKA